jgi:hypothetical protein
MMETEWRAFFATSSKLYLARASFSSSTQERLRAALADDPGLQMQDYWGQELASLGYVQDPSILGSRIVLCERVAQGGLEVAGFKRFIADWAPPRILSLGLRLLQLMRGRD